MAATFTPATPAAAQGADALQLTPTTGWTADFADDSCALRRAFSDGTDTVILELLQFMPQNYMEVGVVSSTLSVRRRRAPQTTFLPGGDPRETLIFRSLETSTGESGFAIAERLLDVAAQEEATRQGGENVWTPTERDQRERQITGYFVGEIFEKDFVLQTGSLHAPMNVMRTCLDDLVSGWGLDATAHHELSRHVSADYDDAWLDRMVDRQTDMMTGNATLGRMRVRLLVDERGRATDCKVLDRDVDPAKGNEFCVAMIETARFEPALGKDGQPIKSYFMWQQLTVRSPARAPAQIRVRR